METGRRADLSTEDDSREKVSFSREGARLRTVWKKCIHLSGFLHSSLDAAMVSNPT